MRTPPRDQSRFRPMAAAALLAPALAIAQPVDEAKLQRCKAMTDAALRLACYDAVMETKPPAAEVSPQARAVLIDGPERESRSLIGDRWGLGVSPDDSRFDLRAHRPSYMLLGRYSDAPNTLPSSPSKPPLAAPQDVQDVEAKFQVSFKFKLADFGRDLGYPLSVWAGYTQQSQWQVYNRDTSRPFRETNYEPELMLATHPDLTLAGWHWRLAAIGLNHQSNGRSEPLSRSWNRVMLQAGVERGDWAVLMRGWYRVRESASIDDNPDLTRFLGHGDVTVVWAPGTHQFSLTGRSNIASGKGAVQGHWTFPLARRVRGIAQVFSGYGESLIDYNVRQTTFGLGISLADHL
ncbi:MAG: phospholipase A, partial [Burkholderiaceae bacterium]|nr:phospholipase A [Burkholderiaceae bacterium]